jgi:TetR/AcrR family transcriptional regulator, regulator of autoinduction and epiphytic fitness
MDATEMRPDRRRLRAERNQEAVVDAMLDLHRAGNLRPGAAEIARQAGVSERTVFRLFDDLEALRAIAIERQLTRIAPLFAALDNRGTRDQRLEALITHRLRLYEEVAPVLRAAAMRAPVSPVIRQGFAHRWALFRTQMQRQFRRELDRLPEADRGDLLTALDAAASLEALEYLHDAQGLDTDAMRAVLTRTLRALLRDACPEE